MPDLSAFFNKFFKADDFKESGSRTMTIKKIAIEEVGGGEGRPKEQKPVLYFEEDDRGVTLNKTRNDSCVEIFGSKDSDKWIGGKVQLVFDPNVKFGSKKIGGIAIAPARA